MSKHFADAVWRGNLKEGKGNYTLNSSGFKDSHTITEILLTTNGRVGGIEHGEFIKLAEDASEAQYPRIF